MAQSQLEHITPDGELSFYPDDTFWSILSSPDQTLQCLEDFCASQDVTFLLSELELAASQLCSVTEDPCNVGASERCLRLMSSGTVVEVKEEGEDLQSRPEPAPDRKVSRVLAEKRVKKSYVCDYEDCDKRYKKSSHLKAHQRVHTGERPYQCGVQGCGQTFVRSDELTRHTRRHTGARPFTCSYCSRGFARSDHLALHVRRHLKVWNVLNIKYIVIWIARGCFYNLTSLCVFRKRNKLSCIGHLSKHSQSVSLDN